MQKVYGILVLSLFVNACAVSDDPAQGGFFGGVYGITSGGYDRRVDEREQNLAALKNLKNQNETEQQALTIEKTTTIERLSALREQSQQLSTAVSQLTRQINSTQAKTTALQQKKQALAKQAQQLQGSLKKLQQASAAQQVTNSTLQTYENEEKRLRQEIAQLKDDLYLLK
ncbi:hypothetical protein [Beggiatoa leptomitoformis]|uniref:Lipoprotein n=1 Tax=Beggiatoa leptomitoformis TaxID=288004 RepID=A0A2N9YH66_9GAMM|nr:hypothetical protein [Beggiatoa leptomitoformis]AUI69735.1 hypothetical protein BLE401_14250 [Beggiatoa leptomitoformis]QGX03686.1 hypothetical protein AL038_18970 [Beggiatoa leptomitoformis]